MRFARTRTGDATFELNLAPFLDIIVSIVPMLLLSIAFVQVKMIESPTPQMVTQDQIKTPPKPETTVTLHISNKKGITFEIVDEKGKRENLVVDAARAPAQAGQETPKFNLTALISTAIIVKGKYPKVTTLQMAPEADIAFDDLVQVMDTVRERPHAQKPEGFSFTDKAIDAKAENRQLFPDIVFASVGG